MYHEVFVDEPPAGASAGASRYHVSRDAFRRHLDAIAGAGVELRTVGNWVAAPDDRPHVALTFDDGWAGSLSAAVTTLVEAGHRATFFVTRDFVGKPGFADAALLGEAHAAGMEIGAHGATHRFLSECSEAE